MSYGIKIDMQMIGGDQLLNRLSALDTKTHNKIVRQAVREAGRPVLRAAKANAKSMVGGQMGKELARHMVLRKQKKRLPRFVFAMNILFRIRSMVDPLLYYPLRRARVRKSGKKVLPKSFLPAAIEYGHGANKEKASIPFIRTAFKQTKTEAYKIMERALKRDIEAEGHK